MYKSKRYWLHTYQKYVYLLIHIIYIYFISIKNFKSSFQINMRTLRGVGHVTVIIPAKYVFDRSALKSAKISFPIKITTENFRLNAYFR